MGRRLCLHLSSNTSPCPVGTRWRCGASPPRDSATTSTTSPKGRTGNLHDMLIHMCDWYWCMCCGFYRAPRLADEKEYLYAPYSCFMITKVHSLILLTHMLLGSLASIPYGLYLMSRLVDFTFRYNGAQHPWTRITHIVFGYGLPQIINNIRKICHLLLGIDCMM